MNHDYNHSDEVAADIELAAKSSDEEFEKEFHIDAEEREKYLAELQSDLAELRWEEQQAEWNEKHHIDDWQEAYADPRL